MLQLVNKTPLAASMFLFPNEEGIDTLYVAVKATFDLSSSIPRISEKQKALALADEYWGEPGQSSLKYATEAHLMKPGCDVAVVGDAFSPKGDAVGQLDISLSVSDRSKSIRVWGDRRWEGIGWKLSPGRPEPFERMPIVYERAFGGMQTGENQDDPKDIHAEPFNPVGVGFRGRRSLDEMKRERVPNLEDPKMPFTSLGTKTRPIGFGFIAPSWAPRMHFIGTYDERWRKKRAPFLPTDFDPRFFQCASLDWVFEEGLPKGAPIRIENMSSRGVLEFELPDLVPGIEVVIEGRTETPDARLETLLIEPNDERCSLTWRAFVPCDKKALAVSEVRILG